MNSIHSLPEIIFDSGVYMYVTNHNSNTITPISICPVCNNICPDILKHIMEKDDMLHIIYVIHNN